MTAEATLTTADGIPLKDKLRRTARAGKIRSFGLALPLLAFIVITFVVPIGNLLYRSVYNPTISNVFPETLAALQDWNGRDLPSEATYAAMARELLAARKEQTVGRAANELNFDLSGMRTLITDTARKLERVKEGPWKEAMIGLHARWGEPETWGAIRNAGRRYTPAFYVAALDHTYNVEGKIVPTSEDRQIYVTLFLRTLWVSLLITGICLVLGYPVAYLLANAPTRVSNLLMILVLLPFWTSLLVRTTAWVVILQREGVLNQLMIWLGIIEKGGELQMIYNMTGTIVAMTQILLPFMILPLFSVMKTIPKSYMRAAQSLGATPEWSFLTVYLPNTIPGIGAGSLLVFILAIGYYITPALVGGRTGQLISNFIAFHMQSSLNWGLAGALSGILLLGVLALYFTYNRIIGVDKLKLG